MNKKVKIGLKVLIGLIVVGILMHMIKNVFIPFIIKMHSGGAY